MQSQDYRIEPYPAPPQAVDPPKLRGGVKPHVRLIHLGKFPLLTNASAIPVTSILDLPPAHSGAIPQWTQPPSKGGTSRMSSRLFLFFLGFCPELCLCKLPESPEIDHPVCVGAPMSFDLRCYLEQFAAVCESKFGRRYDLSDLERRLAIHRDGKHLFTAKDVARVFNPDATPFAKYWPRPHTKVLEEALARERLKLAPLPPNPADLIGRLLAVFHNLGTVSLILQFVYPERFAIFSTPVIHLVQVTRPVLMEMYLAYCDELRVWSEHFHMPSVAATSTALWTYAEITKQVTDDPHASAVRREFEEDIWVQRRRAAQVIRPFIRRYGRLQLAQILLEEDPGIAGKIAAEEYERLLNIASRRMYGRPLRREKGAAGQLLADLAARGIIDLALVTELQLVWEVRNRVVHPNNHSVTPEEVERMVDTVERVCRPWGASNERFNVVRSAK
jgi:hypothetical protein